MSTITEAERVAAGAAYLDEHDPDWWRADTERAIDLGTLDMQAYQDCVLGQRCPLEVLAAHVGIAVSALDDIDAIEKYSAFGHELAPEDFGTPDWPMEHGFTAYYPGEFRELTGEWKRVITERRSAP
jgi:hypothetical protein